MPVSYVFEKCYIAFYKSNFCMALKMSRGVTIKQKQVNTKRVCAWHGQNVAYGVQLERERERERERKLLTLRCTVRGVLSITYLCIYFWPLAYWLGRTDLDLADILKYIFKKKNSKCCL